MTGEIHKVTDDKKYIKQKSYCIAPKNIWEVELKKTIVPLMIPCKTMKYLEINLTKYV